ncbi:MAG: hypothetical protein QM485_06755 [Flavobacteriaceae bacterium]
MKKNRQIAILLFIFLMTLPLTFNGQVRDDAALYYNWFDAITGLENSELHYGQVYMEKYKVKNKKSQFFYSPDFVSGTVVFDGQIYFGLNLKYNIYDDEVLMRIQNKFGGNTLQLYKDKISGFTIVGHQFIKIDSSMANKVIETGFYEVSSVNLVLRLLKKHKNKLNEHLGEKSSYHEFEDSKKKYVLWYQGSYHPIKKIADLTALFPNHKEKLDSFYKSQKSKLDVDTILYSLLVYLETQLPKGNEKTLKK